MKKAETKIAVQLKVLFFLPLVLLLSCSSEKFTKIFVVFDNAEGLIPGAAVETKGLPIGHVRSIRLKENKVIAELALDKKYNIPRQSTFTLKSADIFGRKVIEINFSSAAEFMSSNDTVAGIREKPLRQKLDSLMKMLSNDTALPAFRELKKALRDTGKSPGQGH